METDNDTHGWVKQNWNTFRITVSRLNEEIYAESYLRNFHIQGVRDLSSVASIVNSILSSLQKMTEATTNTQLGKPHTMLLFFLYLAELRDGLPVETVHSTSISHDTDVSSHSFQQQHFGTCRVWACNDVCEGLAVECLAEGGIIMSVGKQPFAYFCS